MVHYVESSWPSNVLTIHKSLLKAGAKQSDLQPFGHPVVVLPYVEGVSQQIAKMLSKVEMRSALKAQPWQWKLCRGIKDVIPKDRKGVVYEVSFEDCSGQYVRATL